MFRYRIRLDLNVVNTDKIYRITRCKTLIGGLFIQDFDMGVSKMNRIDKICTKNYNKRMYDVHETIMNNDIIN